MQNINFEIVKYSDKYRQQVFDVWEKSVLATHSFLTTEDFYAIRKIVGTIDFNAFDVYCLTTETKVIGFVGSADKKLEMLFLSPDYFGKGLGKRLLDFAVLELKADKVDVNEQNIKAVEFYKKYGFTVYKRTDKDEQGRNYPILKMALNQLNHS
ncbi:MAG TPA: GNAT family N-acetyltransferase [Aquaticitalea sp.]|nr:GNAT family N-acetyltransferase [Aquaticitalea sp.]HNU58959.1 GNAT family N-acetyltransferase [Aquaticitalea sp.]